MTAEPVVLSPRAAVALLTLQLRAAEHEAAAAEAEASGWDVDASLAHLRASLEPKVEARRRELDEELTRERKAAADSVAAARTEAAAIVAEARASLERERQLEQERAARAAELALLAAVNGSTHDPVVNGEIEVSSEGADEADAPTVFRGVVADSVVADAGADHPVPTPLAPDACSETVELAAVTEELLTDAANPTAFSGDASGPVDPATAPAAVNDATVETLARLTALRALVDELMRATAAGTPLPDVSAPPESVSIKVVIDADSFSKAFSSAIASVMDERLALNRAQQDAWVSAPWRVPPVAPRKKSFWANTWHADVLLSLVAMVILLVVFLAWST